MGRDREPSSSAMISAATRFAQYLCAIACFIALLIAWIHRAGVRSVENRRRYLTRTSVRYHVCVNDVCLTEAQGVVSEVGAVGTGR